MTDQSTETHRVQPETDLEIDYKQYLHSVFGECTAEYFLNLSSLPINTPAWYTQMKNNMGDHVSAEAFWNALRKRSAWLLTEADTKPSQDKRLPFGCEGLKRRDHMMHLSRTRLMFNFAHRNRAYAELLLDNRPLSPFYNTDKTQSLF